MSDTVFNTNSSELMDADEAFEMAEPPEVAGVQLYFANRHYFLFLAIREVGRMSMAEAVNAAFWVGTHDPIAIKSARRRWRNDPDGVFDDIEDVPDRYGLTPGSSAYLDAAEAIGEMIQAIEGSADEIDKEGDDDGDGAPGK